MNHPMQPIREDRELTEEEKSLIRWLLEHGSSTALAFLPQLEQANVFSRCPCGCASIDLSIAGNRPTDVRMRILADYQWRNSEGHLFGIFVFEQDGLLAGIDLWSIDGQSTPNTLPPITELTPLL